MVATTLSAFCITGCTDQPDKYESTDGTPRIDYIRRLSSEIKTKQDNAETVYTNGQLVTSAAPNDAICFVGDNLRSIMKIFFNDKEAAINTSLVTDNTLIINVPGEVPNYVTDKIYLITTGNDTLTYDFSVEISAPVINSMSCEYAHIGDEIELKGQYIIDDPGVPLTVEFTGAGGSKIPAVIKSIADDYTSLTCVIPEGAEEGPITVTSIYGASETVFHYLDTRGMMFEFDGKTGLGNHGWHDMIITADEYSLNDGDHYLQLGDGSEKDGLLNENGDWNDKLFSFEYWCGSWDDPQNFTSGNGIALYNLVDFSNAANMTLKFEMQIPKENPWCSAAMQLIFAGTNAVTISGNGGYPKANNTFFKTKAEKGLDIPRALYRPWTETGSYDTGGKWITVSIPIASSFTFNFDGSGLDYNLKTEDFASFTMFVIGGGVKGTACNPIIRIDNIRVIPNK
ncbi:MAG: hypothetical protein J5663_08970 [Bacteroidaceae bacterium]|nr:hypothetical protein [Bacteroidaceae bacterium]